MCCITLRQTNFNSFTMAIINLIILQILAYIIQYDLSSSHVIYTVAIILKTVNIKSLNSNEQKTEL